MGTLFRLVPELRVLELPPQQQLHQSQPQRPPAATASSPKVGNALFRQLFDQLRYSDPAILRNKERAWYIEFAGEHADDYGGPYREALCPSSPTS